MKFFRKLGFQLVLFFIVAITIPIVMLMVVQLQQLRLQWKIT